MFHKEVFSSACALPLERADPEYDNLEVNVLIRLTCRLGSIKIISQIKIECPLMEKV